MYSNNIPGKTRPLLAAGALFVFFGMAAPAHAQGVSGNSDVFNRLNQIENQIQTMSRAVYRGDKNAMTALENASSAGNAGSLSAFDARVNQIEEQQRKLTGQLEKISFDIQQIKDHMDRMQAEAAQQHSAPPPQQSSESGPAALYTPSGTLGSLSSSEGHHGTAEALYDSAFTDIRDSRYEEAEQGFKKFLGDYPKHPLAANAQYWLGETYYVRGDYKQAAKTFAFGYQNFPKGAKAPDSLLKLGLSLSRMGKKDDACLSLRQLQKESHEGDIGVQRRAQQEIKQLACP